MSPDCHNLHVNVLLRSSYHRRLLKLGILSTFSFFKNTTGKYIIYEILKLFLLDMKIMPRRNGGGSVNNSSCGLVVYRIIIILS